mmetsp:Transcript_156202/g.501140  ORF Transcript_156202/g.501140 Transcript_156202/m.501140 type:complete len:201 (-) Transcript_156202:8-610(-)
MYTGITSKTQKQATKEVTPSMSLAAGYTCKGRQQIKRIAEAMPRKKPNICCVFQRPQQHTRSDSTSNIMGIVAACLSSLSSVGSVLARCIFMLEPARESVEPALDTSVLALASGLACGSESSAPSPTEFAESFPDDSLTSLNGFWSHTDFWGRPSSTGLARAPGLADNDAAATTFDSDPAFAIERANVPSMGGAGPQFSC